MKLYVASSWRNLLQPAIVLALRRCGHEVYDFRAPAPGKGGFSWSEIDPEWQGWTAAEYRAALKHPIARAGYALDIGALRECEACVLVLPSGRSASWEFGYAMGQGKRGFVISLEPCEPELMYSEATIITDMHDEFFGAFGEPVEGPAAGDTARSEPRECSTCLNRCMDMDIAPYCAAVNAPYGLVLHLGRPKECGAEGRLWEKDTRR